MTNQQQDRQLEHWRKEIIKRGFEIDLLEDDIENKLQDCIDLKDRNNTVLDRKSKLILYLALCSKTPERIRSDYFEVFGRIKPRSFEQGPANKLSKILKTYINQSSNTQKIEKISLTECVELIEKLGYRRGDKDKNYEKYSLSVREIFKIIEQKNQIKKKSPGQNETEIIIKILREKYQDNECS